MALTAWELLLNAGYNVIPIGAQKRPLAPRYADCYERRCPELAQLFESVAVRRKQAGVALLGRVNPWFPQKVLVIIDVDDPSKLPPEAHRLLEGAWHWLTGPRCPRDGGKHEIKCEQGRCVHGDHEFSLAETPRGEAFAVLVPAEAERLVGQGVLKLLGGAVEVRLRGYQLIPSSIHPSGILYEWVTPPWGPGDSVRHPKELSLEEFKRLLELLGHEFRLGETPQEREGGRACARVRELTDGQAETLVEAIKPYYIPGFRNAILYSTLGILWRLCFSEASIRKFYEALQSWAASAYTDIDRRHDDYILEGVLSGRDWHLFGWPKLRENLIEIEKSRQGCADGDDACLMKARAAALEALETIRRALGLGRRKLILISDRGVRAGRNARLYYVNDPSVGLAVFKRHTVCWNECAEVNEKGKCVKKQKVCRAEWGFDVGLKGIYLVRAVQYTDPITGATVYSAVFRDTRRGVRIEFRYAALPEIVRRLRHEGVVGVTGEELERLVSAVLIETARRRAVPFVAGVIYDPKAGQLEIVNYGPYAPYFRRVLEARGNPGAFAEFLRLFYGWDPKALDAYAVGLFQIFNAARKQGGLRCKALALVGEPGTGKTQLALTIAHYIFGLPEEGETGPGVPSTVHPAGTITQPQRFARSGMFTTAPKVYDEGGSIAIDASRAAAETFKRAVTGLIAYETAVAGGYVMQAYPFYAGIIITTQQLRVSDPGIMERLHVVTFTAADVRRNHETFVRWREEHRQDLLAFGRFYLETLVNMPDVVFRADYVEAAREALARVLERLDVPRDAVAFPGETGAEEGEGADPVLAVVDWIVKKSYEALMRAPANERVGAVAPADAVSVALSKFGAAPFEGQLDVEGDAVKLYAPLIHEVGGTSLENFALRVNEVLGRETARIARSGRRRRVDIALDDLLELVRALR
jgi:hypothetical protein